MCPIIKLAQISNEIENRSRSIDLLKRFELMFQVPPTKTNKPKKNQLQPNIRTYFMQFCVQRFDQFKEHSLFGESKPEKQQQPSLEHFVSSNGRDNCATSARFLTQIMCIIKRNLNNPNRIHSHNVPQCIDSACS